MSPVIAQVCKLFTKQRFLIYVSLRDNLIFSLLKITLLQLNSNYNGEKIFK